MTVLEALDRQTAGRTQLRERLELFIGRSWDELGSWDRGDIDRLLAQVLPLVAGGQLQTAQLTDVYLATVISEMTGRTVRPTGVPRASATGLRGVDPAEVYARPFVELWSGLAAGMAHEDARTKGRDRLLRLVEDDLSLAHRRTVASQTERYGATRYRRVIRPELRRSGVCGLCIAAADQTYGSGELLPIHTRCACDVLPIIGSQDPAADLNGEDTRALYKRAREQAGSSSAKDLAKVRFTVHEHGELGPVLRPQGEAFTGPDDLDLAA